MATKLAGSIVAPMAEVRAAEADGMEFVSETVKPQGKKVRHFAEGKKPGRRPLDEGGKRNGEGESAKTLTASLTDDGVKCNGWTLGIVGDDGQGKLTYGWYADKNPHTAEEITALAQEAKNLPTPPAVKSGLNLPEWLAFFGVRYSAKPTAEERAAFANVAGYIGIK